MYYAYILKSQTSGYHYIGSTSNLEKRLMEHNYGKNRSTRKRGPWDVVYKEEFMTKQEAVSREYKIKSFKGGNEFKKLLLI